MSCDSVRNLFSLFLYGELSFEEEEAFHLHLGECAACREELERERALHATLDQEELEPAPELLVACRARLHEALPKRSVRRNVLSRFWAWTGQPMSPALWKPAGALALVAIGFFGARFTQPSTQPLDPASAPASVRVLPEVTPVTSQVRYVQPDSSGGVRIFVDETHERVLSGSLGDAPIQQLVLAAARDANDPGLRLESLDMLRPHGDSPEVRRAFMQALQKDPNAGVRMKAIEGLKPYGRDPQVRAVLARVVLNDENIGVRTQAIDLLVQQKGSSTVGVLQQMVEREQDAYIRERVERALREMNASLGAF
jgi:hypothetical protein